MDKNIILEVLDNMKIEIKYEDTNFSENDVDELSNDAEFGLQNQEGRINNYSVKASAMEAANHGNMETIETEKCIKVELFEDLPEILEEEQSNAMRRENDAQSYEIMSSIFKSSYAQDLLMQSSKTSSDRSVEQFQTQKVQSNEKELDELMKKQDGVTNLSKIRYPCLHCNESFLLLSEYREHQYTHKTPGTVLIKQKHVVKCSGCDEYFPSLVDIKRHDAAQNCKRLALCKNQLACDKCEKSFVYLCNLRKHKLEHLTCKKCFVKFPTMELLENHMKTMHKDNNKFTFKCETCHMIFKTSQRLKNHINLKHNNYTEFYRKELTCEKCGLVFYKTGNLSNHLKHKHKEIPDLERMLQFLS